MSGSAASDALAAALPVIESAIDFVRRRHRLTADQADELRGEVHLRLLAGNGLARFEHRSSLRTYLITAVHRVLLDMRDREWQRRFRPSAEARRLGPIALDLEQLIVRDSVPLEEAIEMILTKQPGAVSRETLVELCGRLPRRLRRRFVSEDALHDAADRATPEDALIGEERSVMAARAATAAAELLAELPADDALLLRMRFTVGATVAKIARVLGLEQKSLYRRIDRLLETLRDRLEARGFSRDDVVESLGGDGAAPPSGDRRGPVPIEEAG